MRRILLVATVAAVAMVVAPPAVAEPEQPGAIANGSVYGTANLMDRRNAAARRECPRDMPNCTRVRTFNRNYDGGYYGRVRARADMNYSRYFRRTFMRKAARKWNRTHRSNFDRSEAWKRFTNHDTCFTPKTWPLKKGGCKPGETSDAFNRGVARVLFCGTFALPITRGAHALFWYFFGNAGCQVSFFVR